jgi:hypothetical protein
VSFIEKDLQTHVVGLFVVHTYTYVSLDHVVQSTFCEYTINQSDAA